MYFLFSGEGATDFGQCGDGSPACQHETYDYGPMAVMVDQIVEKCHGYSILDAKCYGYVSERGLVGVGRKLKRPKSSPRLPGVKKEKETGYFFQNARAMAVCAKSTKTKVHDEVVAVLFRDSDGTASAGRGIWEDKRRSMIDGFAEEGFARGVAMVPKPKSEAWLLCALKANPYQGCESLERRSGNDNSPKPLKAELARVLGDKTSQQDLCVLIIDRRVDIERIEMKSFRCFRWDLETAIGFPRAVDDDARDVAAESLPPSGR